ncbi:MAG: hypothetical protein KDA87_26690, partial [Planctomycetales bacterium]|nr:hypothetical protein [Planctomycetales bacterium]
PAARAAYQVGNTVPYTVQRGEETLTLETKLYHWTLKGIANAFAQVFLNRIFQFSPFLFLELALALFVFIKRPANIAAQLLLLAFVTNLVSGISWLASPFAPGDVFDPVARVASYWLGADINPILSVPLFVHLALVFPKAKWGFDKWWPVVLFYALPLTAHSLRYLVPGIPADVLIPLYFLLMFAAYLHSLITIKEPVLRAQMKWLAYAGALWAATSMVWVMSAILHWLPPSIGDATQWFPVDLLFVVCLSLAILKYRLFDIDLIINRTLVYGSLSIGILALYLAMVGGSSLLLKNQTPLFALLVTFIVLGLVLKPFWRMLNQGANRLVPLTVVNAPIANSAASDSPHSNNDDERVKSSSQRQKFSRSTYFVISFALILVLLSVAQKAYRLTFPFEGWSTTTDFESDEPIIDKKLLDVPSDLQTGDRVIAVNGLPFSAIADAAVKGQTPDIGNYAVGQTVDYTILRSGETLEVKVPLYSGTQLGLRKIIWEYFTSNGFYEIIGWLGFWLVLFLFWKRPNNLTAQLLFLKGMGIVASAISWTVTPFGIPDALNPVTFYSAAFFTHLIHLLLFQPLALHMILSFPKPSPILKKRWVLPIIYGAPWLLELLEFLGVPFYHPFALV